MIKQHLKISAGTVLLASPFMDDPNFKHTAVLICSHNDQGTIGFVFNKPLIFSINEVLDSFPSLSVNIFKGGPVENNSLHFLHNAGKILDNSVPISPGVFWSGDFNKLKFLIKSELITTKDIRFFAGYTGWDKGQLEEELKENAWIITNMDANYLFKVSSKSVWRKMLTAKGDHFPPLADISPDFPWN
jgi:putative transcriptional regulator